jgi:hypothetical protein
MAERPLTSRTVPAEWDDEHLALAQQAEEMGLPRPTRAEWHESVVYVEDVNGWPLMVEVSRTAAVSNC